MPGIFTGSVATGLVMREQRQSWMVEAEGDVTMLKVAATLLEQASVPCQLRFNKVFLRELIERLQQPVRMFDAMGLALFAVSARAELTFPALSGRVVDEAQMIEPSVRAQLSQQLQAHEQATGEQLVVVTLPDLQGTTIEDFGVQLGRHWAIGQKDKNNGALLIVARDERKLRIANSRRIITTRGYILLFFQNDTY